MKTAEEIVKEKNREIICVTPDTTLFEALKIMNENKIGSVFIKEDDKIVGVWTERDLVKDAIIEGIDFKTAQMKDYMTTDLVSADYTFNTYQLIDIILGKRLRRLLIQKEGEYIGFLSVGDIIRSCLNEKDQELRRLHEMVSWEYYENWRWDRR